TPASAAASCRQQRGADVAVSRSQRSSRRARAGPSLRAHRPAHSPSGLAHALLSEGGWRASMAPTRAAPCRALSRSGMRRVDPARPLRHPRFWAALALLVVNDHALKGAGVLPGALTGKLSDV